MHHQCMPQVETEIADFRPGDQDEVRSLILTGLGEHWGHIDETVNPDLDDIAASYGHGRTVVVRIEGEIVATGTVIPLDSSTAKVLRMSVAAAHRRYGLGRLLVDELEATARGWGATTVVLETTSAWQDVAAFYRSCGYAVTHRSTGPFGEDTWFRKPLAGRADGVAGPPSREAGTHMVGTRTPDGADLVGARTPEGAAASDHRRTDDLAGHWSASGDAYLTWARTPGVDVGYWDHNRPALLALLPEPGRLTIDLGCGEGRLARELAGGGHRVVGVELVEALARAAATHGDRLHVVAADASRLPLADGVADLVVASMVLMDVDRLDEVVAETARVLREGGAFCFSILHPVNTAGGFSHRDDVAAPFVLADDYYSPRRRSITKGRNGLRMTFAHEHRPLEVYFRALESAGFVVEALREPRVGPHVAPDNPNWQRWSRLPNSLHLRARLTAACS
jgi:SAM-dependent methyltransferase/GNAT superfamily N-acetyltransferase